MLKTISEYFKDKLKQKSTYVTTIIVGTLINVYGQLLVPLFRANFHPIQEFFKQLSLNPISVSLSVILGYLFPFCVTVFTAVLTRYQNRVYESQALFPALKPDPVFRAKKNGDIIAAGTRTQELLDKHNVNNAMDLLGKETWKRIVQKDQEEIDVFIPSINQEFIVVYAHMEDETINVYMTRRKKH